MEQQYQIRPMTFKDARRVLEIFQQGIDYGLATFETQTPTWEAWDSDNYNFSRFVIEDDNDHVIGYCAIKPVSKRECFSGIAEVSVYVDADHQNLGLGTILLRKLILDSEEHHIWTLQAAIFPDNKRSIALHQKLGFRMVGVRHKMGKLKGKWEDVAILERRSTTVGLD